MRALSIKALSLSLQHPPTLEAVFKVDGSIDFLLQLSLQEIPLPKDTTLDPLPFLEKKVFGFKEAMQRFKKKEELAAALSRDTGNSLARCIEALEATNYVKAAGNHNDPIINNTKKF